MIIEMDKTTAKVHYPELFKNTGANNPALAEKIFKDFKDELPDDLDWEDVWYDIEETKEGKIAILSDCSMSSNQPLYIIELEKTAILEVTFSDAFKEYQKKVYWQHGKILSDYDNEILSKNGCWELDEGIRDDHGFIRFDRDGNVLEFSTEGHIHMKLNFEE